MPAPISDTPPSPASGAWRPPRSPRRPPSWSPAARWRWAPTRPRTRAASPSCCRRHAGLCQSPAEPRLDHALPALVALRQAGLEPVPHIAARRVASRERGAGLPASRRPRRPGWQAVADRRRRGRAGRPLPTAAALLRDGLARRLRHPADRVCRLSGGPSAHPDRDAARGAATRSWRWPATQGLAPYVVTQFCFAPNRIAEYCAELARRAPDVPVYVGLAGPTSPVALLRYAQRCGVGASLRALQSQGMGAVRLVTHADPSEQLTALARHSRSGSVSKVVGVHLYSFGGVARTARWMNERITARG